MRIKLTAEVVAQVIDFVSAGYTVTAIAELVGVSRSWLSTKLNSVQYKAAYQAVKPIKAVKTRRQLTLTKTPTVKRAKVTIN